MENCAERAPEFPAARVTLQSSSEDKLTLFRALFRGREDVYSKRWQNLKTGQSGIIFDSRSFYAPFAADITDELLDAAQII